MVTRRQFFTYAGTGLLLAGAPMATACSGARRDDLSPPGQWKEPVLGLERDEMEILSSPPLRRAATTSSRGR